MSRSYLTLSGSDEVRCGVAVTPADPTGLRREILDAALALVETRGLDALSIREVARRAGVTHQAPYHHFRDRAAILAAIALEGFVLLRSEMIAARDQAPARADARFMACGLGYFRFAIQHRAHFKIMFRSESHPPRRADLRRASAEAMQVLVDCVVDAQAAGLAPAGDPVALVVMSWSTAHGIAALWVDGAMTRAFSGLGRDSDAIAGLVGRTLTGLLKAAADKPKK